MVTHFILLYCRVESITVATKTLVIVNPHARSGKAGEMWKRLEPAMIQQFGELVVAITDHPREVLAHLDKAQAAGLTQVIAIGGDGTNHEVVNAIMQLQARQPDAEALQFGQVPLGTGQDFARILGIPTDPFAAISWLAQAHPRPIDVGQLDYDGQQRYFLNIASAGTSGDVTRRIEVGGPRRPWTFWSKTVQAFLSYQAPQVTVHVDGELWYEGDSWLVAVANGSVFGRGMKIAPHARIDDGRFDVVLVEATSRLTALRAFNTVYWGRHLQRDDVHSRQARLVEISAAVALPFEVDGESQTGQRLRFELLPGALQVLTKG